jgi:hypothetical protein
LSSNSSNIWNKTNRTKIAGPDRDSNLDEIKINLNLNLNLSLNLGKFWNKFIEI